jgi:hypothetical protein
MNDSCYLVSTFNSCGAYQTLSRTLSDIAVVSLSGVPIARTHNHSIESNQTDRAAPLTTKTLDENESGRAIIRHQFSL